jgi:hypothetical protein
MCQVFDQSAAWEIPIGFPALAESSASLRGRVNESGYDVREVGEKNHRAWDAKQDHRSLSTSKIGVISLDVPEPYPPANGPDWDGKSQEVVSENADQAHKRKKHHSQENDCTDESYLQIAGVTACLIQSGHEVCGDFRGGGVDRCGTESALLRASVDGLLATWALKDPRPIHVPGDT